jgi:hypothetical protein
VPVCFYQDGEEITRYKNIEIPDELKELDIMDFRFNVTGANRANKAPGSSSK